MAGLYKKEYSLVNKYMPKPSFNCGSVIPRKTAGEIMNLSLLFCVFACENRHGTYSDFLPAATLS